MNNALGTIILYGLAGWGLADLFAMLRERLKK